MNQSKVFKFFSEYTSFSFPAKKTFIQSEEKITHVFFLSEGIVKQTTITPKGQELCLNLYKANSFFPLMEPLAGISNQYAFTTLTPCVGWKAPVAEVRRWIQETPDVSYDLNVRLLKGLHGMLEKTSALMQTSARVLIVQTLMTLRERFPFSDQNKTTISIPMTHQKLADSTGLSRETVTRELTFLQKLHLLSVQDHMITMSDPKALARYMKDVMGITSF